MGGLSGTAPLPFWPNLNESESLDDESAACRWGLLAIEEAIAARIKAGVDIPADTAAADRSAATRIVHTPLLVDLKVELYRAVRAAGVTRAELTRRLGWNRNSVDRLFDLNHASRLDQIEAAMAALGIQIEARRVEVESVG